MIALFSDLRLLYAIGDPVEIEDFESAIAKITERADDLDYRARNEDRFWHRIYCLAMRDTYRNAARDLYTAMWQKRRERAA